MNKTIAETLSELRSALREVSETPTLDAQSILQKATGLRKPGLLSNPERELSADQAWQAHQMLERCQSGEPLPYILGQWEFFGNRFAVNNTVLIPRPETETLVETACEYLNAHPMARKILDIGTGSGCIALSLARLFPTISVTACDISPAALAIAEVNRRNLATENVLLLESDLFACISGRFDVICANLPYIPSERCTQLKTAKFEPLLALDGGVDGLTCIRSFLSQAQDHLSPSFLIICEIEYSQKRSVSVLAHEFFPSAEIKVMCDLAGLPRLLSIQQPSKNL